ncbi:MAG TPA: sensor histidine kinase [Spirochaetia bacterium]|nr:sensor histidine kinase [Spirochaetia bacterium]
MARGLPVSFRNASIQTKLIITFGVFFMIPLLVSSVILYLTTTNDVTRREYDRSRETLQLLQNSVESQIQEYTNRTVELYYDRRVFSAFRANVPAQIPELKLFEISQALQSFRAGQNYLDSIYLFLSNGQCAFADTATDGRFADIFLAHPEWAAKIEKADGRVRWLASVTITKEPGKIVHNVSFGRVIRDIYSGSFFKIGILVVNLSTRLFDKIRLSNELGRTGLVFVTDADNRLIWSADRMWYDRNIAGSNILDQSKGRAVGGPVKVRVAGSSYFAVYRDSSYNGWHYYALVPQAAILNQIVTLRNYFVAIFALCLVFFAFGAMVISRYVTVPLERLIVAMNETGRESSPPPPALERSDEIGFLYKSFNSMFRRIGNLIAQIELSHKNERAYEMRALQAQINPHFLYNTLDTINWLAREKGETKISRMLTSLSRILQYAISNNGMVRWSDELKWLENYIFIQQIRFEGKFAVRYEIDRSILDLRTFHLLLQPFVENAIIHGFRDRDRGGMITIRGNRNAGRVVFEISDNGCGIDERMIEQVVDGSATNFGIANVNQRIQLTYGTSYGVAIGAGEPEGTRVVITFPVLAGDNS